MRGKAVTLDGVAITYPGGFTAVHPTDLHIQAGEFFSILGPSGCGKTTILRAVSGFIEPSDGRILIGGEDQRGMGPNSRPTALIFQNLALFPLMPVWENVAFGLEARGMSKRDRRERAMELINLVALDGHADKKPGELSGGQRQRVAIARALAVEPSVLLLDEPLSALDLKLRQHMRSELRAIQRKTGVTFIYITHDQGEALTMSDRIAVMNAGIIEQVGSSDDIYANPDTAFVADFVGETNKFSGRISMTEGGIARIETEEGNFLGRNPKQLRPGDAAVLFVRPEQMSVGARGSNSLEVALDQRALEGAFVTYHCVTKVGKAISLHRTNDGVRAASDMAGKFEVGFATDAALILPAKQSQSHISAMAAQ